jgi:hypothetical protein
MAGTIVVDRLESDASYASSINIASPVIVSNTFAFPAGSNTAPAITPSGDTNTGIFFPAADTIAFSEGGVESMRISNTANVGIGTTNPTAKLNIVDGFVSYVSSDANGYPRFTTSSGSAQIGMFRSGIGSVGGGYIGADLDNCLDVRDVAFTTRMKVTAGGDFQMNSGYGSVATAYGCRAWVNFNGTGTVAIRGSGNVSSITDNGTGIYTINFTTAMPDTNYSGVFGCNDNGNSSSMCYRTGGTRTTTAFQVSTVSGVAVVADNDMCMASIFR